MPRSDDDDDDDDGYDLIENEGVAHTDSCCCTMKFYLATCIALTCLGTPVVSFTNVPEPFRIRQSPQCDYTAMKRYQSENDLETDLSPEIAEKFKIMTCMSTACSKKRSSLGMDPLSTFGALYERIENGRAPTVQIEEMPCLGACKHAPCVAIEHSDFEGTVSLEGMMPAEFQQRVFHNVVTEEDADRIWSCVENAVELMQEEEEDEG